MVTNKCDNVKELQLLTPAEEVSLAKEMVGMSEAQQVLHLYSLQTFRLLSERQGKEVTDFGRYKDFVLFLSQQGDRDYPTLSPLLRAYQEYQVALPWFTAKELRHLVIPPAITTYPDNYKNAPLFTTAEHLVSQKYFNCFCQSELTEAASSANREDFWQLTSNMLTLGARRYRKRGRGFDKERYDALAERFLKLLGQIISRGIAARNEFVEHNTALVRKYAHRWLTYNPDKGFELGDLEGYGSLGLMEAAEQFDYTLGNRFSTYATWKINKNIRRALQNYGGLIRIPIQKQNLISHIQAAADEFEVTHARKPKMAELAQLLNLANDEIEEALMISGKINVISLDMPLKGTEEKEDKTLGDLVADRKSSNPEEIMLRKEEIETFYGKLNALDPRVKDMFKLRSGLKDGKIHTMAEIGKAFKITRARVGQILEPHRELLREAQRLDLLQ